MKNWKTRTGEALVFSANSTPESNVSITDFLGKLTLFYGLPFNYLVPNNEMLPLESLRVFEIDPDWIEMLIDGATSIGRRTGSHMEFDRMMRETRKKEAVIEANKIRARNIEGNTDVVNMDSQPPVSGFLLRSGIVAGWPGLEVEAFDKNGNPVNMVRMDRLSKDVLLCLFSGDFTTLKLKEPPEGLHFGADYTAGVYTKELRSLKKTNFGQTIDGQHSLTIPLRKVGAGTPTSRVVNIQELQNNFIKKLKACGQSVPPFTSAEFAVQMIETAQQCIITISK